MNLHLHKSPSALKPFMPHAMGKLMVQPKLTVNTPGDQYEQEADAIADGVMRMPVSKTKEKPVTGMIGRSVQRECTKCEEEEKKKRIMRKESAGSGGLSVSSTFSSFLNASKGGGKPLPQATRGFMENAFSSDFSAVKIHTGNQAFEMSKGINAKAFTSGNDIYFNSGQFDTYSMEGKKLLAHELTHVVQQNGDSKIKNFIQRQSITLNSGRIVGNNMAASANLKEDVLDVMDSLHASWSMNNPDYISEYPVVSAKQPMSHTPVADIPKTILAIHINEQPILNNIVATNYFGLALSNNVGHGMTNTKADVSLLQDYLHTRWHLSNSDYTTEIAAVNAGPDPVVEASIPRTIAGIGTLKKSKLAEGYGTHDVMRGTHPLIATQGAQVEAALIPGATSSGGVVNVPSPDAICSTIPALETEIRANIVPYVHTTKAAFNVTTASAPVLPIASMYSMADIVQQELENYFGSYLRGATHNPASKYTPGNYTVRSQLRDQSTTVQWQTPAGRKSWVNYWISTRLGNVHHCKQSDLDTVGTNIATDPLVIPDIDRTVQSWPAEATGGININPFIRDPSAGVDEIKRGRWDAFTIIIHEALHHLVHPNFQATYDQMNNDSMQILKEGFNDMFRHELWFDTGQLKTRIADPSYNSKRATIEGVAGPYNSSVVFYHSEYPQITQAAQIRSIIGDANAKAAYFLGHTELLGLGAGTHGLSATGNLTNIASYHITDPSEENRINTLPGETFAKLTARVNAPTGSIMNITTGNVISSSVATLPGTVRVNGLRHVTVIAGDTINSIASQNRVTPFDLIRANNLSSFAITIGQRLIIPVH